MSDIFAELMLIVMETYPAIVAETVYVITGVQAALQFVREK